MGSKISKSIKVMQRQKSERQSYSNHSRNSSSSSSSQPMTINSTGNSSGWISKTKTSSPSSKFRNSLSSTLTESIEDRHSRAGLFCFIPRDLCLYMIQYLDIPTINILSQTCSFWNVLCRDNSVYRKECVLRFHLDTCLHQKRLSFESLETSWRDLYVRLDSCLSSWKGFAMDKATNRYDPYPMEWIVTSFEKKSLLNGLSSVNSTHSFEGLSQSDLQLLPKWREQNLDGVCRWISIKDALTRTKGVVIDDLTFITSRFGIDPWLDTTHMRMVMFEETEIIRGENIAVPNKYFGMMIGPLIMGVFDPGHPEFVGVFALMMEEATPRCIKNQLNGQTNDSMQSSLMNETMYHIPALFSNYRGLLTFANPNQRRGFHCQFKPTEILHSGNLFKGEFTIYFQAASKLELYKGTSIQLQLTIDFSMIEAQQDNQSDTDTLISDLPHYKAQKLALCKFELIKTTSTFVTSPNTSRAETLGLLNTSDEETNNLEEQEQSDWIQSNLPMNDSFSMYRMGDYWIAYLKEPKTGIFFIHIN